MSLRFVDYYRKLNIVNYLAHREAREQRHTDVEINQSER